MVDLPIEDPRRATNQEVVDIYFMLQTYSSNRGVVDLPINDNICFKNHDTKLIMAAKFFNCMAKNFV